MPSSSENRSSGKISAVAKGVSLAVAVTLFLLYARDRANPSPVRLTLAEETLARAAYEADRNARHGETAGAPRLFALRARAFADPTVLPYLPPEPRARSAILVDARSGEVLLERNADEPIPPASMTKLVAMYVALDAIRAGEISLDDAMEPPSESWAVNLPPRSSLMFLGEGQIVTVRELLAGMASVSGNDAAIALAYHLAGSVSAFVERMNAATSKLGLSATRFVEPSGLSERNVTTAREFASFCLAYLDEFPESLAAFHSLDRFAYPLDRNYPDGRRALTVRQAATNRMLGTLPGCDGLKTGYIDESGYNIALTARRGGERYLAVIMGGAGNSSYEGNRIRTEDGIALMEWSFASWTTAALEPAGPVPVTAWGGGELFAIDAGSDAIAVPRNALAGTGLVPRVSVNRSLAAPVRAGDEIGYVEFELDGVVAYRRPLVADRSVGKAGLSSRALDAIAKPLSPLFAGR